MQGGVKRLELGVHGRFETGRSKRAILARMLHARDSVRPQTPVCSMSEPPPRDRCGHPSAGECLLAFVGGHAAANDLSR